MATQKGIHRLKGRIGEATYYKTRRGYQVRERSGVDGSRIKNDPAFKRTRENFAEFGLTAKSGQLLRSAIGPLLGNIPKTEIVQRVSRCLTAIKNLDPSSARGSKNVATAIALPAAKALLKDFNFNSRAMLASVLRKSFTLNPGTGNISIPGLSPASDLAYPAGATHAKLTGAWAKVDFQGGQKELMLSNPVILLLDGTSTNVQLNPAGIPSGTGTDLYLLKIEFLVQENGVDYSLSNGSYNALCIVEVV